MSTTIDYEDSRIDAGGDSAYDSSNYGTTTGLADKSPSEEGTKEVGEKIKDTSNNALDQGKRATGTTEKEEVITTGDAKTAQGYEGTENTIGA